VNRRLALLRLAALPGALALAARAQAQPSFQEAPQNGPAPVREAAQNGAGAGEMNLTSSPELASPPEQPAAQAPARPGVDELLFKAMSLIGTRYRMGGMSPDTGFDCSGFVSYLYNDVFALRLPRTTYGMVERGTSVARNELQPGDLVFFNTMRRPYTHVGLYVAEDRFVHAPASGGLVRIESLNERYWAQRWNGARRVLA
jgi:cell wall-associated NlpC family hydrolase